jgi:hypothetical protein
MDTSAERDALNEVARRLADRFEHLPPDLVRRVVDEVAAQHHAARIREFIPLLVEKQARDELRAHAVAAEVPRPREEVARVDA